MRLKLLRRWYTEPRLSERVTAGDVARQATIYATWTGHAWHYAWQGRPYWPIVVTDQSEPLLPDLPWRLRRIAAFPELERSLYVREGIDEREPVWEGPNP